MPEEEIKKEEEKKEHEETKKSEKDKEAVNEKKTKNKLGDSALWPLLSWILFSLIFFGVYAYLAPSAKDIANEKVLEIFGSYSKFVGIAFGFLSMLGAYILFLIKKLVFKKKFAFINPLILAAVYLPWFLFARQLVYFENRYTDIARGVITYVGEPLWYSSIAVFGLAGLWFLLELVFAIKNKKQ